ncbi:hypothetical protein C8034_v001340 [Colletotrichum sidae]|uniref:F-box domain-containing protein n=1 Tax=Colletotrichum sidae TaxID=1347389 RepID=A0A4R8TEQ2_9PEZI|nr:hypothetical protein C8034_v001340 [Colletotrichum sidae]
MPPLSIMVLPNELIANVVSCLAETGVERRKLLVRLSKTNRVISHYATLELYRSITVDDGILVALLKAIIQKPALRHLVRHLEIAGAPALRGERSNSSFSRLESDMSYWNDSKLNDQESQLFLLAKAMCFGCRENTMKGQIAFGLLMLLTDRVESFEFSGQVFERFVSHFLVAGMRMMAMWDKTKYINPTNKNRILFPACTQLRIGKGSLDLEGLVIWRQRFRPVTALLFPTTLTSLTVDSDDNTWRSLDTAQISGRLALRYIRLNNTKTNDSGLCKLLKRCPGLLELELFYKTKGQVNADVGTAYSINNVLPVSCPQLQKLTLSLKGRHRQFFTHEPELLTCLTQMVCLRDLRIDLDCLFKNAASFEVEARDIHSVLPPNLDRLFLDSTWFLSHLGGRAASHPDTYRYKEGMEWLISPFCHPRTFPIPRNNIGVIIIAVKHGRQRQWQRTANQQLRCAHGTVLKFISHSDAPAMWSDKWESMVFKRPKARDEDL